jgi:hypothetical protein
LEDFLSFLGSIGEFLEGAFKGWILEDFRSFVKALKAFRGDFIGGFQGVDFWEFFG